jgi:hypothetical protein
MPTLKIILRSWFRSALSSTISLLSLAIGLLCSTILLLFAVTEFRMAKSLGKDPNIYVVEQDLFYSVETVYSPIIEKKELIVDIADKYPEVIGWTIIGQHIWKWQYEEKLSWRGPFTISATPSFTKFITIPMEEGCLDSILAHPNAIAITRTYANLIFPGENPIGKTIYGEQDDYYVENPEKRTLVVEGIIDDSFKTFLNIRAIFSRSEEDVRNIPQEDDMFCALIKLQKKITPESFIEKIVSDVTLSENYDSKIRLRNIADF